MSGKRNQHLEWIDLLRGLASLGVVLFHVRIWLWVGWMQIHSHQQQYSLLDRWMSYLSLPMPLLGSGVMLFFLISGFCIHYPQAGKRRWDAAEYAVRRFWRIYPPYLAAVVLTVAAERLANVFHPMPDSGSYRILMSALMAQNYTTGQLVGNTSLWSLPIEMELYIAYPLFLLLLWRSSAKVAIMAVGLVSGITMALRLITGWEWVEINFAKYWIIWCAGAWLAEQLRTGGLPIWRPWHSAAIGIALAICITAHAAGLKEGLMHYAWGTVYFLALWRVLSLPHLPARMPKPILKASLALGTISYSLYLIHLPYFKLASAIWLKSFGEKPINFLVPLGFALSAVPLAYVFYRCVEAPFHRAAMYFGTSSRKGSLTPATVVETI